MTPEIGFPFDCTMAAIYYFGDKRMNPNNSYDHLPINTTPKQSQINIAQTEIQKKRRETKYLMSFDNMPMSSRQKREDSNSNN